MSGGEKIERVSSPRESHTIEQIEKRQAKEILQREARQIASTQNVEEWAATEALFTPRELQKKFKPLKEQIGKKAPSQKGEKAAPTKEIQASLVHLAKAFEGRNPELQKNTLLSLYHFILPEDSEEKILEKLQTIYKDQYLADEAIDFLIQASETREALKRKLIRAKERFNSQFGREILAGRNIASQALGFSEKNLGTPTALRNLYRELTGNPRKPYDLFNQLTEKFKFSDMKNIIDFILHSLGADLKAKGPSIARSELQRLLDEGRTMQAILGLFRFFYSRMKAIRGLFDREDLIMPSQVNFERLAKMLMQLLQERYPSEDRILKLSYSLGIAEEIAAQIIIFSQYRDAMRNISPKLFFSERHRTELLHTLIETLSNLEDALEEEEEE